MKSRKMQRRVDSLDLHLEHDEPSEAKQQNVNSLCAHPDRQSISMLLFGIVVASTLQYTLECIVNAIISAAIKVNEVLLV